MIIQRVVIIGSSSSGKTTLGKKLANKLSITHEELDALYWEPNWKFTSIFLPKK